MRIRPLSVLLAIPLAASAQQASKKQATTTVTGHVYCADTNAPARLASVMLEPVRAVDAIGAAHEHGSSEQITMTSVQTTLDGSFTIPNVSTGTYYVVAYMPGYLSPLATFPADVLSHPSAEDKDRIARVVPKIAVDTAQPASIDIRLERGGAISGTVLFDDGSPAPGLKVHALVRHKEGQKATWSALRPTPFLMTTEVHTDDLGRYRLEGLPPREYEVQADLELQRITIGMTLDNSGASMSSDSQARLLFCSGNTARKRDAASFKLTEGEERTGEDITIPLSKLHTISGEIIAAHDGHLLNMGTVQLLDAEDKSELETASLERADGKFHLLFVPEGNYILRVSRAADAAYEDVPYPPGTMPRTHEEARVARWYGTADQPINIHDDAPTVVISVPEKGATATPKQAAASQ
ncbi:MAG: carboxypeptidase regulatory-like domain-containing protein [Acidobacteriota bacterium]